MIAEINEPQAGYQVSNWHIVPSKVFPIDESILGMNERTVFIRPPVFSVRAIFPDRTKRTLSKLRGKISRQTEKEIDDQILDLRSEWDRNI